MLGKQCIFIFHFLLSLLTFTVTATGPLHAACLFSPQLDSPGCCTAGSCDKTAAKSPRVTLLLLTRRHWSESGSHRMVGRRGLFLQHFWEVVFARQPTLKAGNFLIKLSHISLLKQEKTMAIVNISQHMASPACRVFGSKPDSHPKAQSPG